ncbi:MAG TPA: response regulator [Terriglobales bacterium]
MSQRVLLIDDSPLQLCARKAVLRDAGFDVCIATTTEGALALLRSGPVGNSIATVVTDHVMPGVSGADFVKAIRKIRPQIPIIVITGLPEAEPEYEGLHIEFRHKPCHPSDLIALVRRSMSEAA